MYEGGCGDVDWRLFLLVVVLFLGWRKVVVAEEGWRRGVMDAYGFAGGWWLRDYGEGGGGFPDSVARWWWRR